jgi:hypothetical protein
MAAAFQVKNTFLELAQDDESDWMTSVTTSLKRQSSEPVPCIMAHAEAGRWGILQKESAVDEDEIIRKMSHSTSKFTDTKAWGLDRFSSADAGGSTADTLPVMGPEERSSCNEAWSAAISSEDEDFSQCDNPERQTSEDSSIDMKSCDQQASNRAVPEQGGLATSEEGTCYQMTEQSLPMWGVSGYQMPQVPWVPTMMVPMFQWTGDHEHRQKEHRSFAPKALPRNRGMKSTIQSLGGPGCRRKQYSLITLAQQAQDRQRQQQPALNQMQLQQLRTQLEARKAELSGSLQESNAERKPVEARKAELSGSPQESNAERKSSGVAFCPFCGGAIKPGYKFCGYCGKDVSEILAMSKN